MKKTIVISQELYETLSGYLDRNSELEDYGKDECIWKESVDFGNGFEVDVKIVNSEGGPYVDVVLFLDGIEQTNIAPTWNIIDTWEYATEDEYGKPLNLITEVKIISNTEEFMKEDL